MKIAMIGHKRIPGREGGVEVVVEELTKNLVKRGHSLYVYNRNDFKHPLRKEYVGARLINIFTIPHKFFEAIIYSFLSTIHATVSCYDIIHYHAIGPATMLIIPHFFKLKTVVTVHGLNYKTPKWKGFAAWYIKMGEKITAKYADEIIVLSKDCQAYFKDKYNRDTMYIPNGVDLGVVKEVNEVYAEYGLEKDQYILYLSRIVPGKGLEYLLDAYREVDSDLKLVIAGDSVQVDSFYQMIKEKASLDSRVMFTGFVKGNCLNELFSNAKMYVFPSEAEGMAISLLEAMSYNCPCIASDIPENSEVGKDYIRYFKNTDVNSLKEAIEEQLTEGGHVETRDYVEQNFNWKEICKATEDVYQQMYQTDRVFQNKVNL